MPVKSPMSLPAPVAYSMASLMSVAPMSLMNSLVSTEIAIGVRSSGVFSRPPARVLVAT